MLWICLLNKMAPSSKLGRGKPLKHQTKEVLHKIYRYFKTEIDKDPNSTVTAAQLVTHSTGISRKTINKVISEFKVNAIVKKEKKEYRSSKRRNNKNITSDDFDAQAVRRIIHSFYTKNDEFPIMKDIYLILKADIDYQGSLNTLRRHVSALGFKWKEREDNNSILIEKHDIRYTRVQYLSKMEAYRSQTRNIVYTGEAAIESSRLASKPKADGSSTMLKQPAKTKLVILLAGDQTGLVRNTLFMCDAFNFEQYEKWYKLHLIPNLKPNSIVIVDGASAFHNRILNPCPHSNSRKKEMMDFLTARNVPYSPDMYKPQLYQLVLLNKDKFLDYKTDALLREHAGHIILRVPPHHPDLNPMKNILAAVKNYVGEEICLKMESIKKIVREKVTSITSDEWNHVCKIAEAEENNLRATDKVIDEISESAFRSSGEETDDSDIDDENGSDQDSMDSD